MTSTPSDNRDKVIQRAKEHLLKATNIEDRKEECKCLTTFLSDDGIIYSSQ